LRERQEQARSHHPAAFAVPIHRDEGVGLELPRCRLVCGGFPGGPFLVGRPPLPFQAAVA
jgi:hypothetical protein